MTAFMAQRRAVDMSDTGFTLIEMMVTLIMVGILGSVLMSVLIGARSSATATATQFDLTAEARTALNRITTDLREATPLTTSTGTVIPAITAVNNPDGADFNASGITSLTFNLDVSADGCVAGIASNNISAASSTACSASNAPNANQPESESICWDPTSKQVYLLAVDPTTQDETAPVQNCGGGIPLLAGKVSGFKISYGSSLYRYQNASGVDPRTGMTSWYDLDAAGAPVGNRNSVIDMPELRYVDTVSVQLTMSAGGHTQVFSSATELRNVHPDA
jgi:prepilin-type N-terminal cleavage/methylation domain-containing protein